VGSERRNHNAKHGIDKDSLEVAQTLKPLPKSLQPFYMWLLSPVLLLLIMLGIAEENKYAM